MITSLTNAYGLIDTALVFKDSGVYQSIYRKFIAHVLFYICCLETTNK